MTLQDEAILSWMASQACEYHNKNRSDQHECGFCGLHGTIKRQLVDAFIYGKDGRIPLELASSLMG